jgi:hypothetical protein
MNNPRDFGTYGELRINPCPVSASLARMGTVRYTDKCELSGNEML